MGITSEAAAAFELPNEGTEVTPEWLLRPCDPVSIQSIEALRERANSYFTECAASGRQPSLTGLALVLGVSGPTGLQRMAQRRPELRWIVSRCLTAVAYGYEGQLQSGAGAQGAIFMLKHLPEFDPQEPAGSKPVQYWTERRELVIDARVAGVRRPEDEGTELTPREAYLKVIHGEVLEDTDDLRASDQPVDFDSLTGLEKILADDSDDGIEANPTTPRFLPLP